MPCASSAPTATPDWVGTLRDSYSARPVDYTQAYAIQIGGQWHTVVRVRDLGDHLDIQISSYQGIQCRKDAVDAIKVIYPADTYVGKERKFDIEVRAAR